MLRPLRRSTQISVGVERAPARRSRAGREADDHHMHMGFAARLRRPFKRTVRERDLQTVPLQQHRPQSRDLFALGDRVGRNESDLRVLRLHVFASLEKPRGHVIQMTGAAVQSGDAPKLPALRRGSQLRSHERRIAEHVRALARRQYFVPIDLERVFMVNVRCGGQWDPREAAAELFAHPPIHEVVHHPQRRLCDETGEVVQLDPVELVHIDH